MSEEQNQFVNGNCYCPRLILEAVLQSKLGWLRNFAACNINDDPWRILRATDSPLQREYKWLRSE